MEQGGGTRLSRERCRPGLWLTNKPRLLSPLQCAQTTYYQKQTRSADEPMTTFASCLTDTCLHRWRFC